MKGLTFALGALAMAHASGVAATNYANQLEMQNCGGYSIKSVELYGRKADSDSWTYITCYGDSHGCAHGDNLLIGEAMCYDLTEWPGYERFRLKGKIESGDNKTSDDTNYAKDADQRRVFRMKGTTLNNNRPNSRGYKATLSSGQCDKNGASRGGVNCTAISWRLDDVDRRRG